MDSTLEVKNFIYECIRFFLRLNDLPCDLEGSSPCDLFNEDVQRVLMYVYDLLVKKVKLTFLENECVCFATEESFVNVLKNIRSGILGIAEDWILFLYFVTVVTIAAVTAVEKRLPEFVRAMANAISEDITKSHKRWVEQKEDWKDFLSFCKGIANECSINTDSEGDSNPSCLKQPRKQNVQDIKVKVETEFFIRTVKLLSTFVENIQHLILASLELHKGESSLSNMEKSAANVESCSTMPEKPNENVDTVSDEVEMEKLEKLLIEHKNDHERMLSDLSVFNKAAKSIQIKVGLLQKRVENIQHLILSSIQLQKNESNWSDMEKCAVNVGIYSTMSKKPNENVDTIETEELEKLFKRMLPDLSMFEKALKSIQIKMDLLKKNAENKHNLILSSIQLQKDKYKWSDMEKSAVNVESCSTMSEKPNENVDTVSDEIEIKELEKLLIEHKHNRKRILSDFSVLKETLKSVQIKVNLLKKDITGNWRIHGLKHSQTVSKESKNLVSSPAVPKKSGNFEESRVVLEKIIEFIDLCSDETETGKKAESSVGKLKNHEESDAELQSLLHIRKKFKK